MLDLSTGRRAMETADAAGSGRRRPDPAGPSRAGRASWAYGYVRVLSNLYVVEGLK